MHLRLRLGAVALPDVGREVWLLCLATGLINAGYLSMMGLLKTIFVLRLGYDAAFVGTIMAVGSLSFALSSLLGGILGGRFGARPMMIAGAAMVAGGMALLPLTEFVPVAIQPLWPPLVQIVTSAGWAWVAVNLVPALTAFSEPENRKDAYGLKEAAAGSGMFLGAIVGGLLPAFFAGALGLSLDTPAPYRYALMASVLVALAALIPIDARGRCAAHAVGRWHPPTHFSCRAAAVCRTDSRGAAEPCGRGERQGVLSRVPGSRLPAAHSADRS